MAANLSFDQILKNTFHMFPRNESYAIPGFYDLQLTDATFPILMCLIIFQLQTGLALFEAGIVQRKNRINITMKITADVCIGGLAFYIFGFALAFGRGQYTNPFFSTGDFFVDAKFGDPLACQVLTLFLYQMSYATTSNTLIAGAIAERARFSSYCILTFLITILYSVGCGWMWGEHGWLRNIGAVDLSGGVVHIVGGAAGLACTIFIGPRTNRYEKGTAPLPIGNNMYTCISLFVLWWGWFAFNAGCSYGVTGGKWEYAVRAGINTALASWGGGFASILFSMLRNKGRVDILEIISGVLSALVMANACCYLIPTWLAVICGAISAILTIIALPLTDKFHIDDPIGVMSVHWLGGALGYLAVGLFAIDPVPLTTTSGKEGVFMGGGPYFLIVQCIAIVSLTLLGFLGAFPIIWLTNKIIPIRLTLEEEEKGSDMVEHGINDVPEILSYFDSDFKQKFDENKLSIDSNNFSDGEKTFCDLLRQRKNFGHVNQAFNNDLTQINTYM